MIDQSSGKWHGYFIDHRDFLNKPPNSKWDMEINMEFTNNKQFTATGSDEVGPFTFKEGKITGMVHMALKVNYLTFLAHRTELA